MITKLFTIAGEPGFDRVIEKIDQLVTEKKSNRSAVTRDILYAHFKIKSTPKIAKYNRSGRKH